MTINPKAAQPFLTLYLQWVAKQKLSFNPVQECDVWRMIIFLSLLETSKKDK